MPSYKVAMLIPWLLLAFSVAFLVGGYLQTGEWFQRNIELKGGTVVSLEGAASPGLEEQLAPFGAGVRSIGGLRGPGTLVEVDADQDVQALLDALDAAGMETSTASIRTIGSSLGENFWTQAQIGIVAAFALMGMVVFFLFRKPVPVATVIFATVTDFVATLAFMQLFGIPLSLASLAALLMLIGYSVDTDILLDTHVLKEAGNVQQQVRGAVKTGLTMTGTTMGALAVLMVSGVSPVITEIATVLLIGLLIDTVATWLMNAGMLRWYMERRGV